MIFDRIINQIKGGRFYWDTAYIQLAMPNSAKTVIICSQKETDTQRANSRGGAFGEEAASSACIWIWKHCKHPHPGSEMTFTGGY